MRKAGAILVAAVLSGCVAPHEPAAPAVDLNETLLFLGPGLHPEKLLFPEYLFFEGAQIGQHGRIPRSRWIGAGLSAPEDIKQLRKRYSDVLSARGWVIERMEVGRQSFRLEASMNGKKIELRGVQGSGPTELFLLYFPGWLRE